jgi:hypothetical protein
MRKMASAQPHSLKAKGKASVPAPRVALRRTKMDEPTLPSPKCSFTNCQPA